MDGAPLTPDHAVDHHAPRWPRLVVVRALLPLGILGALALSAAATIDLAHRHGVPDHVQPAAVAMLEIVSAAGTLLAIFGDTGRLRGRAMVAVASASGVQLVAGVSAYGWFGAVAPIALVGLVHLAAEAWQELRAGAVEPINHEDDVDSTAPALDGPTSPVPASIVRAAVVGGLVYRLWSTDRELLYVGSTRGATWLSERLYAHRAKEWGAEIDHWTTEDYPTEEVARRAEAEAIRTERPKYNLQRYTPAAGSDGSLGPVQGPPTLVEHLRSLSALPSERPLLDSLNEGVAPAQRVTRHRVKVVLREARTGLREVAS